MEITTAERGAAGALLLESVEFILSEDILFLEKRLAETVGTPHCVAVSDAASGIALALLAAGIGPGEGVLCAALGCAVPVQGILMAGCRPLFVDVNPNTYTLDPFCLEYALGKLRRMGNEAPRAVIATDLFGAPCDYNALSALCKGYGLALIEDLSGAFGARLGGRMCGSFGRFAVSSFATPCPLEELGGGAVFCQDGADAARLRGLRRTGRQEYMRGLGAAPPCMGAADAALVLAQLRRADRQPERRRNVAAAYRACLPPQVRMQQLPAGAESSYSQLVVALPGAEGRAALLQHLHERGVPAHIPAVGSQTAHSDWNRVMLVNTLALAGRLLSLPIHPYLSNRLVQMVGELVAG